ncbi:hypothetical protein [Streptomyces sp. NBC_00105]|uniref:WD40 repeat domain-containing protein n=1 Tax=Streptomyces sp. NBC_00105 TaxID=2903622 RepID=UPI002F913010
MDALIWIVRVIMSWDEFGNECMPPSLNNPCLEPWRDSWRSIKELDIVAARQRRISRGARSAPKASSGAGDQEILKGQTLAAQIMSPRAHRAALKLSYLSASLEAAHHYVAFPTHSLAFSPDGRRLVAGDTVGHVWIWDTVNGDRESKLLALRMWHKGQPLYSGAVPHVAFSPNGNLLAAWGEDGGLRLWDIEGYAMRQDVILHGDVVSMAFSPDSGFMVTGGRDVRLWSVADATLSDEPFNPVLGEVCAVAFLDGRAVAATSDGKNMWIWDVVTQALIRGPLGGHSGRIQSVNLSVDGVVAVSGGKVHLWDLEGSDRRPARLSGSAGGVMAMSLSPDGSILATVNDAHSVEWWNRCSHGCTGRLEIPHSGAALAFSGDSSVLAIASGCGAFLYA